MPAGAGLTVEPACLTLTVLEPSRAWPARSPAVLQQLGDRLGPGSGGTTLGRLGEPRNDEGTWPGRGVGRGVQRGLRALAWEEGGHARRSGLQVGLGTLSLSRFSRKELESVPSVAAGRPLATQEGQPCGGMGRGQNVLGAGAKGLWREEIAKTALPSTWLGNRSWGCRRAGEHPRGAAGEAQEVPGGSPPVEVPPGPAETRSSGWGGSWAPRQAHRLWHSFPGHTKGRGAGGLREQWRGGGCML